MSHLAVIVGISGSEYYLGPGEGTTTTRAAARRFRSDGSATTAAERHVNAQPPVVRKHMDFRVEPAEVTA